MDFLTVLAVLHFFCGIALAQVDSQYKTGQDIFGPILNDLDMTTNVPPKLPAYFAADKGGPSTLNFYGIIDHINSQNYEVLVASTIDCMGETYCLKGKATGQEVASSSPLPSGDSVNLANNIQGRYLQFTCGASCGMSKLFWKQGNYLYSVQLRAGPKDLMIQIANSAISENVAN